MRPNIWRCSPRTLRRLHFVTGILQESVATGRTEIDLLNERNSLLTQEGKEPMFITHLAYRNFKSYHSDKLQHPAEIQLRVEHSHIIL